MPHVPICGQSCARAYPLHMQCSLLMHSSTCSTAAAWQHCTAHVLMLCCGVTALHCTTQLLCGLAAMSMLIACCALHPLQGYTLDQHHFNAVSTSAPAACRSHTGFIACITAFKANKFVGVLYVIGGAAWSVESLFSIWVLKLVRLLAMVDAVRVHVSGGEVWL